MTLLTVVKDVCSVVGVTQPASVFSNILNNRTMQEMLSLANEMARRIAYDTREWNALKQNWIFDGDGVKEAFDLPVNFQRMLKTAQVWRSTSTMQPMTFYPDFDEWQQRRAANYIDAWGEWTMYGGQMHIWPIMAAAVAIPPSSPAVTARFSYLDRQCVLLNGVPATRNDAFLNDNDTFRLEERLLKLGMIWQWKANKGSPYAEDMGNYSTALDMVAGADTPAPIIVGRAPLSTSARVAYPWPSNWGPQ